jgi:hypothetical protein
MTQTIINTGAGLTETKDAPAGHDEAMAAKFDAAQQAALEGTPAAAPEQKSEAATQDRPSWLPEKFKTPEDLAKSYAELEKKLGAPKEEQTEAAKPKKPGDLSIDEAPKDGDGEKTDGEKLAEQAGLNYEELSAKYFEKGALDESDYEAIAKSHNAPKEMVDQWIEGQLAIAEMRRQQVTADIGGDANFRAMSAWAAANLPKAELESYNRSIEKASIEDQKLAVRGLYSKYVEANGTRPTLIGGANAVTSESTDVYRSTAELTKAMSDPRYEKDPAYRQDVASKLARSNIL